MLLEGLAVVALMTDKLVAVHQIMTLNLRAPRDRKGYHRRSVIQIIWKRHTEIYIPLFMIIITMKDISHFPYSS